MWACCMLRAWLWVDTSACLCPDLLGMQPPLKQQGPPFPALTQSEWPETEVLHLLSYLLVYCTVSENILAKFIHMEFLPSSEIKLLWEVT